MKNKQYILTLSCNDKPGIVAAVSGFLAQNNANIVESQQSGDSSTGSFFMRTQFEGSDILSSTEIIKEGFGLIARKFDMEWQVHNVDYIPKVMIMVSKAGHCLNQLLHRQFTGYLKMEIVAVVSNHEDLRDMAEWHKIPFYYLPVTPDSKPQQEAELMKLVNELEVDVVVLARYMQVLSKQLCVQLQGKAINIHHSFLPGFKGANPYKQAFDRGVKIIGATAHYVTEELDEGPIIEQEVIRVDHNHNPNDLKQVGEDIESRVLARALRYHIENRVLLNGIKTIVF